MANCRRTSPLVLIARAKAPAKLLRAVKAAKGEVHAFEAPKARDMPRILVGDAQGLGFQLDPAAARMPWSSAWAPSPVQAAATSSSASRSGRTDSGEVTAADLEEMIADTSEAAVWTLSDAVVEGDARRALRVGEQLIEPGRECHRPDLRPRLRPAAAPAPPPVSWRRVPPRRSKRA